MATITKLTAQARDPERVNVYLDGQFAFGLAAMVAADLQVGQQLSEAEIELLQGRERVSRAKKLALNYVTIRPRSVQELRGHLRKKKFEETEVAEVVEYLTGLALLDDEVFARYWVEQRETFRPRSRMALSQELGQKGIDRKIIAAVLDELDEPAAAQRVAEQKARQLAGLPEQAFRTKLAGYLQRRGFSYDVVRETLDETWRIMGVASDAADPLDEGDSQCN